MNCAEFEEIVHDLDRVGTRGLTMRESALAHAEECSRCALLLVESESLDFHLQALAVEGAEKEASPRVEAAVHSEFRQQKAAVARRTVRWQIAAVSVVAVVLMAVGIPLRHRLWTSSSVGNVPPTQANPAQPTLVQGAPALETQRGPATELGNGSILKADQTAGSFADDDEYATDFVALPFADDPEGLEGGAVVRVVLSRSALASLGLPAMEMGGGEDIPADLILSDDGTPQAIRLVSQARIE